MALRDSACVVIPSRVEGLPTVLLEAMHAGTPVVMADVNGLGSIGPGMRIAGLSVPCEDPDSLAQARCHEDSRCGPSLLMGAQEGGVRGITSGTGSLTEYWTSTGGR